MSEEFIKSNMSARFVVLMEQRLNIDKTLKSRKTGTKNSAQVSALQSADTTKLI